MDTGSRVAAARAVAGRMMRPERWERIKDLFNAAIEQAPEARGQLLDQACATDPELRAEVDSLLAAHDDSDDFIDWPAALAVLGIQTGAREQSWIGRRLGPYRIVEKV